MSAWANRCDCQARGNWPVLTTPQGRQCLARADGDSSAAGRECKPSHGVRHRQNSRGVLRAGHVSRYAWIQQMSKQYPVSVSCQVLEVSASGYFSWLGRRENAPGHGGPARRCSDGGQRAHSRANRAQVRGEYAWPRVYKELLARGIRWAKSGFASSCSSAASRPIRNRKFVVATDSRHGLTVAPEPVQRRFKPEAPD